MPTAEDIVSRCTSSSVQLQARDIIVDEVKVDLTNGSGNPMDNVSFFHYLDSHEKIKLEADQISGMFPMNNRVRSCRTKPVSPRMHHLHHHAIHAPETKLEHITSPKKHGHACQI